MMRDKMFGRTVSGFGSRAKRTAPSPYVSLSAVNALTLDSDFATLQIDGSNFSFPTALAVGTDKLIVGLAAVLNLGGDTNLLGYDFNTSSTLSTGTASPTAGDMTDDGSGNEQTTIRGMCFSFDGSYLYVAGQADTNRVIRFDLGTPYDITSVTSQSNTAQLGSAMNSLQGIAIIGDGTKFYAVRSTSGAVGQVIEYAMSTPYDLTTLSTTRTVTAAYTGNFSGGFVVDMAIAPDGSSIIIGSLGGSASAGYQTILDQWPLTNGDITPISGTSGRVSGNFSKNLGNTYDSVGDDSAVYSQGFNFNPGGDALLVCSVHMDDGPSGSSNQWHVTRWT